ncbi:VOC family protein [Actinomycetospora termitidis]|uniref:VOC family protein n=1 Tax=Actinomycetospora termitidis TaxID=3053470 RepID=A0ABT7M7X4_9PSEU|nr:VOC family protein [Actinomycetospora sp. Odt1-22]MDL5156775.1 VOC family protein [Actinomycetospora sp. Odt1-22]
MSLAMGMVTVDCADPRQLAAFWCGVLGTEVAADYGGFVMVGPPAGGVRMGFQQVPEERAGKNRVHLDLNTDDRVGETTRVVELGARVLEEHVGEVPGLDWTTLADPEGNVFCVGEGH